MGSTPPLCFTGHVDTVPLGNTPSSVDVFAGEIIDGKMYGRGSTDMKCGVAAFVAAIGNMSRAAGRHQRRGSCHYCRGGDWLRGRISSRARRHSWTCRRNRCGGANFKCRAGRTQGRPLAPPDAKGVTAHGSMPHLGVNAAYKAARVLTALENFQFNVAPHPYLGSPTLNVGTVRAGLNVNSVPDLAEIGVDIRSIPGLDHSRVQEHLKAELGDDISLEPIVDVGAVWTHPSPRGSKTCMGSCATSLGRTPAPSREGLPISPTRPP